MSLVLLGLVINSYCFAGSEQISSDAEKANAVALGSTGPTETSGVESSEVMALIPLAEDFPQMSGYSLRSRRITVADGGVIGVHQHKSRPGILYMLEGKMTEYRSDADGAIARVQGDVSKEVNMLVHWWKNDSGKSATVFVVDIVANQPE